MMMMMMMMTVIVMVTVMTMLMMMMMVLKVNDDEGNLYKFKASAERLDSVLQAVSDKLKMPKDAILLKYQDDDGDQIVLSG